MPTIIMSTVMRPTSFYDIKSAGAICGSVGWLSAEALVSNLQKR